MMQIIWQNFLDNPQYYLAGLYAFLEVVTRLVPTKNADGLLKRIGTGIDIVLDVLRIPNRLKKD